MLIQNFYHKCVYDRRVSKSTAIFVHVGYGNIPLKIFSNREIHLDLVPSVYVELKIKEYIRGSFRHKSHKIEGNLEIDIWKL